MRCTSALAALAVASTVAAGGTANAEEGLFVARLAGGVSAVQPGALRPGGALAAEVDLWVAERVAVAFAASSVLHPADATLALGLGPKLLPIETEWTRVYFMAAPSLLLVWPREGADSGGLPRVDLALQAALGVEYLMMWGLGLVLEVGVTLPAGLGPAAPLEAASAGLVAGLFAEF